MDYFIEPNQELERLFWREYEAVFSECQNLVNNRMEVYVGKETILEYWINGQLDLLYEINKKNLRLRRSVHAEEKEKPSQLPPEKPEGGIEDQLRDMINYAAFLLALRRTRRKIETGPVSQEESYGQ